MSTSWRCRASTLRARTSASEPAAAGKGRRTSRRAAGNACLTRRNDSTQAPAELPGTARPGMQYHGAARDIPPRVRGVMSLIGSLDEVRLADVLRLFAAGKKTGRLTVSSEQEQAVLHFLKGGIVHAHVGGGAVQGDQAVVELFGWKEGQLTFIPDDKPVASNVTRGVDQLILEGVRAGETAHRIRLAIPSEATVFQMAAGPEDAEARLELRAGDWRVLRMVDGSRDVAEIVAQAGGDRGAVMETLLRLIDAGFLEMA